MKSQLEAEGHTVILVDNGDSIQGEPIGTVTRGEAIIELMNEMGYDIAIPGNHEFDYGMEQFLSLIKKADFPYISCNFNYKGELQMAPYVIKESDGKKIAFVGVTTPKTLTSSTPRNFQDENGEFVYGFMQDSTGEALYEAVQTAVDGARAEGADYVVVMGHIGLAGNLTYADIIANTNGIDVFLDGHSHDSEQVSMKNKDGQTVLRTACGMKLQNIGWCRITPDGKFSTGLYQWNNEVSMPELLGLENDMTKAVAKANAGLDEKLNEVVAFSDVELTINDPVEKDAMGRPIRMIRRAETNLGDFCADAYLKQSGADIAFVNGGGIRVSIRKGDITFRDIISVHPFGNKLCVVEVTGQTILDMLEWGCRGVPNEAGGFQQVAGISFEIHTNIDSSCVADDNGMFVRIDGARRIQNVKVGDEPLDPQKTYTLASHDYLLKDHGGGFSMLEGAVLLQDCVKLDNQVLIDYVNEDLGGKIGEDYADPYGQGRITIIE